MQNQISLVHELFELANRYPSPHNGQPIQAKQLDDSHFELYFETKRGLQAAEVSYLFSFVTMGVFMTHLRLCAEALGHALTCKLRLPPLSGLKQESLLPFASCTIRFSAQPQNTTLLRALRFRQTSRKKYFVGLNEEISSQTVTLAAKHNMELVKLDRPDAHQAIWLNQRAVFDDMFDDAVRRELDHWLRYSAEQKETKRDGLSYDCMELSGSVMKFIVKHYKLLRMPRLGSLLQKYYLRTMSDNSDIYYLLTPFSTEQESFEVGSVIMELWAAIAAEGYYLHPFGTIMSNAAAHQDFLELAHIEHEDQHKNFLVFIYRAGKSDQPNASLRLAVQDHLLRS